MNNPKITICIQEEVNRINILMGSSHLVEQSIGGLPTMGGLSGSGIFDPLLGVKTYNWFDSFDRHDWASFIEITTGILGMIPTPASPFLLGISVAAGLTDAKFYFDEGDPYMGALLVALAILPAVEFIKAVPGGKPILKKGASYVKNLLKKARSLSGKKVLSTAEKETVKEAKILIEQTAKNADELAKAVAKQTVKTVIEGIIKTGGRALFATASLIAKLGWAVGKPFVIVAGIYYTYDEIYLALYGSDQEKLKLRYNSRFQQLVRGLKILTNLQSVEEQAAEYVRMNQPNLEKNSERLAQIDYTKREEALKEQNKQIADELQKQMAEQISSPSLEDVLSKKINTYTGSPYVIKKGQKGESVGKIQKMLNTLDLGIVLKGYKENTNPEDSVFGENTFDAVLLFQGDNNLDQNGIVDSKTLSKLIKSYKNVKKNEK